MTAPLDPVGVSAAAKAPCPVCGKSIHALDGAMSSGGEPMRHMDCERAASIDYAAAFDILYRRALDNQRTVNALVEVTTQEDGEPWEHDGLLMQLYSDDSTSWSTYESCVLAVAGSPADEPDLTRYFIGVSADRPMEVQFTEADGPGGGFYEAEKVDALIASLRAAASPADERLREALELIRAHARLDLTERDIAEAERYATIADDALAGEWPPEDVPDGVSAEATGVWPDQSAQHAVLLEQIKDAYAEGKADAVALIRERAALALPDLARFTLDEVEAIVGLSAEAAPDGILDELRRPNDEPHVAPSSNPYPRDGATFAGSPEAIAYDRGFAAGLAARDTNEPKDGERC